MSETIVQPVSEGLDSEQKHRALIERRLAGEKIDPTHLWLAVGYFYHGAGRNVSRSFATQAQWKKLLWETGRERDAEEM